MLQGVHLVGEDEDDVYGGFNDYNPAFDTEVSRSCFHVKRRSPREIVRSDLCYDYGKFCAKLYKFWIWILVKIT